MTTPIRTTAQPPPPPTSAMDAERVLREMPWPVMIADRAGAIQFANAAARRMLGEQQTLDGAFAGVRFITAFGGWSNELARVSGDGASTRFELALRAGDDATRFMTLHVAPLPDAARECRQVILQLTGPNSSPVPEERLEVSRRLASLGRMAARVAHELNNPLDGILRYINLALRTLDEAPSAKLKDYLSESRTGLLRMVGIITDLLEFTRGGENELELMSINEVVEQAIRSQSSAAESARVVVASDFQRRDMPCLRGGRLYQVCVNLIKNAIDAMPKGGRLSITTGIVNEQIVIRVSDTGTGLPDPPERVFEPFFTTKPPGKGTGIGLPICRDFVEDFGGTIAAEAGEERGAVFTVRIPVAHCESPRTLDQEIPGSHP